METKNNNWPTVNTSNTDNTRALQIKSKDLDTVLGKIDFEALKKTRKLKEKALKSKQTIKK